MADHIGQQLGNYRLLGLLGKGGFAEVYLGEHLHLGMKVAVKVLNSQMASDDIERFRIEARTIARLVHPHIVRVFDYGVENGIPFLVMDYIPKGSLRKLYPKGTRLPLPIIVTYVKQVASALQYAHDRGFVHRDIKPDNILLGDNDDIFLSDFGIVTVSQTVDSQITQNIAGTWEYMAPEQIKASAVRASDQYSLAAVVYEWLSGAPPFQGTLTELTIKHATVQPPSLHTRFPDISMNVEQVVMRALAKSPHQRFASVQEFADALETAGQPDQPVQSTKAKVWSIGMLQIVAMIPGAALFGYTSHILISILVQGEHSYNNNYFWILPAIVILLFFGVIFGPWVGLFTGGVGFFIGNYISGKRTLLLNGGIGSLGSGFPWYCDVALALVGFIAGLALFRTRGHYNNLRNIAIAEVFSTIGTLVAFFTVFNSFSDFWNSVYGLRNYTDLWRDFTHIALPTIIPALILLPILLLIYNTIVSRRRRAYSL